MSTEKLEEAVRQQKIERDKEEEKQREEIRKGRIHDLYSEQLLHDLDTMEMFGMLEKNYSELMSNIGLVRDDAYKYVTVMRFLKKMEKGPVSMFDLVKDISGSLPVSENACKVWDKVVADDLDVYIQVPPQNDKFPVFQLAQKAKMLKEVTGRLFGIEVDDDEMEPYGNYHFVGHLLWAMKRYGAVERLADGRYQIRNDKVLEYFKLLFELVPLRKISKDPEIPQRYLRKVKYVDQ